MNMCVVNSCAGSHKSVFTRLGHTMRKAKANLHVNPHSRHYLYAFPLSNFPFVFILNTSYSSNMSKTFTIEEVAKHKSENDW